MPDQLHQILTYSSRCYYNNLGRQDDLANAYLAIVDKTNNVIQATNDPADMLAWLSRAHPNASLLKACKDTLARYRG